MFDDVRHEYSVRTCPMTEVEELEDLLNDMSDDGWELYMLHEAESQRGSLQYNCIFYREVEEIEGESDEVVDVNNFKTRMEKMITPSEEPSEKCKEIQNEIVQKQKEIDKIKALLDSSSEEIDHDALNQEISENLDQLSELKYELLEVLDPELMYERIGQEKLTIELSDELSSLVDGSQNLDLVYETVNLRQQLTDKLGYVLPAVKFTSSDDLESNEYRIKVRGLKVVSGFVYPGYLKFYKGQSNIENKPKGAIDDIDPISGQEVFWIKEESTKNFWEKGTTAANVIANVLQYIVCRHVDEILDYSDINKYIEIIADKNMYLIENLIPDPLTIGDIRYIFAGLLRERVSIKDLTYLFERLNDLATYSLDKDAVIEKIRVSMSRQISNNLADDNGLIHGIVIGDELAQKLESLFDNEEESLFFVANDPIVSKLTKRILEIVNNAACNVSNIAVVATPIIRPHLYYLLEELIPGISVISHFEISNDVNLEVLEEI